ncbi:hypothetical protein Acife_2529 [Acidithiobacillus ferrivorans SS3]|jgi:uncharacterized peroxidase-related enzyme|uniref:Carboxymuconolactone decarboxylase family protein n=2 Tax=Acidithiobacillus ferrivorans TaxID=160808 RepID=A0A1B9C1P5_9PROT|nr:carboxymuconolactone decarboxylase family protein [Acidithiobacillus ferrivorans]MBN6742490.1 carboxymuconolactone decarboxylase family protein [Acidithiobacillus sp. MC6.1]AEM48619.1 hypothetical protein Acife_2529 [Acidithiobacillus ferrivorans SS3]MBU2769169.1 hypothetical protein [Acidithiobacillus ferrivorans]MBU2851307.1 hypothetical protein [Acidithiobacillus ferrivorans]OCB03892.1 hypothetical protein BBC27_05820 [Acidithiobacillus ferrivorans]
MPILHPLTPEKATGKTAKIYQEIEAAFGRVPAVLQVQGWSEAALSQQWESIKYYRNHPHLSPALTATIRMLVSQANHCDYCVGFNEALLIDQFGQSPDDVSATKKNPEATPLPEREKAILLLTLKAVQTPAAVSQTDMDRLIAMGWSEGDIMDAVIHGARNQMIDVIMNTFKIERDF